jgi:hypothetical protein
VVSRRRRPACRARLALSVSLICLLPITAMVVSSQRLFIGWF